MILPAALADALLVLSRQERVSLFMVILAGFKCLLHRYSGDEEIGVGSCAANRPLEEVEGLIGRFGNSMLLRTSLSGNPTYSELFKRVREVTLNAWSHQEVPFGMLLETIGGEAGRNRKAPFQVMFNLQNAPKERWQLSGLNVEWLPLETGTSKLDLIFWLKVEPALEITLEYSTQLFNSESIKKIFADYQAILEMIVKNPKDRVSNIPILAKPEPAGPESAPTTGLGIAGVMGNASVEARMIELWKNAFGSQPIDVTQDFFELGGDSLLAARLFAQINKTFQRTLPLSVLLEAPTIKQLVEMLCDQPSRSSSSLVSVQSNGTRPPLFCVHGSGGEPIYCRNLSRCLGPDQPVYGLRSRGNCGEPIQLTVQDMAAYYLQAVRAAQPSGPYYLAGFCFGGMVAYEMARLLTMQGEDVALVALFNSPAPSALRIGPLNLNYLARRIRHESRKFASRGSRPKLRIFGSKTLTLARWALRHYASGVLGVFGKRPIPCIEAGSPKPLSVSDANIAAAKAYHPEPYAGRITLFTSRGFSQPWAMNPRRSWGWQPLAAGGVDRLEIEGDHNSLFESPFIESLAEKLKRCMKRPIDRPQASLTATGVKASAL
jgi:thioesterase domain-containing protein/acyl carrier protein